MIIAHFFIRNVRKKPHLFVETTSSDGLEQPEPAATMLMAVDPNDKKQKWVRDAYYAFSKRHPELVLLDTMNNTLRLESDHPSFDMVFRPRKRKATRDGHDEEKQEERQEKPKKE
jgi:hypothetical protein